MGRVIHQEDGMGQGTLGEFQDGSGYLCGGPGRVGKFSGRSETGWGMIGEIRDGRGPSERSGTGQGTLKEVLNGSGETWGDLERVGGPSRRSGTGWGRLGEIRDGFEDPRGGPRRGFVTHRAGPGRVGDQP